MAGALPALCLALAGWLDADAQKTQRLDLADNYRAYIEEQINEKSSLESCMDDYRELVKNPPGCPAPPRCEECPPCDLSCIPLDSIAAEPGGH